MIITVFALIIGVIIGIIIATVRSTYDKNGEAMKKKGGAGYVVLKIAFILLIVYISSPYI